MDRTGAKELMRIGIINDTRGPNSHIGCAMVMLNLERLLAQHGMSVAFFWPAGKNWTDYQDELYQKCLDGRISAVIVNGEGTLHHSEARPNANALAEIASFVDTRLGIPAYIINATFFANSPGFYKKIEGFRSIYVRDKASLVELHRYGVAGTHVPDLTLAFPLEEGKNHRDGIGATDSVYPEVSADLQHCSAQNDWEFQLMAARYPLHLAKITAPRKFARTLRGAIRERRFIKLTKDPKKFTDWLRSKELIITGRYHTVTTCLLTKTPFVAIESNTPKISSLLSDVFGSNRRVVHALHQLTPSETESYKKFSEEERARLDMFLGHAERGCADMIAEIKSNILASRPSSNTR
ncbi:MAG TPA: polysaccharide pyruvyl transferase family protein [Nitrococcus sp.]|nr:polysaccharide pyruvyl transferase family protein [Nitrococcus sp.]